MLEPFLRTAASYPRTLVNPPCHSRGQGAACHGRWIGASVHNITLPIKISLLPLNNCIVSLGSHNQFTQLTQESRSGCSLNSVPQTIHGENHTKSSKPTGGGGGNQCEQHARELCLLLFNYSVLPQGVTQDLEGHGIKPGRIGKRAPLRMSYDISS